MQTLMKRCATVLVLATAAMSTTAIPAMAERVVVKKHGAHGQDVKVKEVKKAKAHQVKKTQAHRHKKRVGQHFSKKEVTVIKNWRARGLPNPPRNQVYVVNNGDLYLATAASLLIRALID